MHEKLRRATLCNTQNQIVYFLEREMFTLLVSFFELTAKSKTGAMSKMPLKCKKITKSEFSFFRSPFATSFYFLSILELAVV